MVTSGCPWGWDWSMATSPQRQRVPGLCVQVWEVCCSCPRNHTCVLCNTEMLPFSLKVVLVPRLATACSCLHPGPSPRDMKPSTPVAGDPRVPGRKIKGYLKRSQSGLKGSEALWQAQCGGRETPARRLLRGGPRDGSLGAGGAQTGSGWPGPEGGCPGPWVSGSTGLALQRATVVTPESCVFYHNFKKEAQGRPPEGVLE